MAKVLLAVGCNIIVSEAGLSERYALVNQYVCPSMHLWFYLLDNVSLEETISSRPGVFLWDITNAMSPSAR